MNCPLNSSWPRLALFCLCVLLAFSAACKREPSQPGAATGQPAAKRYSLKGRVISVDKNAATANIDNEPIAGFMDAMIMPYTIKPPSTLDQLQPGDSITADVVVEPNKYWLENVKVTGHSKAPAGTPTATVHIPNPGDPVPDFKLINQNGQRISLHQYRGQTLLLTLIYTRCPFPDICPRVSHEFAAIDGQVRADPARYGRTHLLSISFDPAHDTPKVLRAYGFSCAGSKDSGLFTHREFSGWDHRNVTVPARTPTLRRKSRGAATKPRLLSGGYLMPNGNPVGPENKRPTQEKQTKKPYTKPAFRFERVFETQALSCGKIHGLGQCHFSRKTS